MHDSPPIKVYVSVNADFGEDGTMKPKSVVWEDGHRYTIDRVSAIIPSPALKAGGQGDRYTIWVNRKPTYLFFERSTALNGDNIGRWFVERRVN